MLQAGRSFPIAKALDLEKNEQAKVTVMTFCRNYAIGQSYADYCIECGSHNTTNRPFLRALAARLDMQALLTDCEVVSTSGCMLGILPARYRIPAARLMYLLTLCIVNPSKYFG